MHPVRGRPAAEFEALTAENNGNGRWLAPEEAVAAGLADKVVEAAEQPASSLARNIARGWERLLANIGLRPGPALPTDRNVLHFDGEVQALRSRSAVAADEARRAGRADLHAAARGPFLRRHSPLGQRTRLRLCRRRQAHAQLKIKN